MLDPNDYEAWLLKHTMDHYELKDPWDIVETFENIIASYAGSAYAVSVDNCTDAMFLCLKYLKADGVIEIPKRTYVSVPCTIINAGCKVKFEDINWSGSYQLSPYPVYDSATRMKRGMYVPDSYYCLSFHRRKHIPIGKGGMILTNDKKAYDWFKIARYEGRHMNLLYKDDYFEEIGWNMYMTPEQAAKGIFLFNKHVKDDNEDLESSGIHKDLSLYPIFTQCSK
jgi:dTDP-4-amino-4,6-dideoxygalactose transaminase